MLDVCARRIRENYFERVGFAHGLPGALVTGIHSGTRSHSPMMWRVSAGADDSRDRKVVLFRAGLPCEPALRH